MSAPPPVQQLISADVARVENLSDLSEYHETLKRVKRPIHELAAFYYGGSSFQWMDVIFNYNEDINLSTRYKEFPNSRMFEVAIGNCRITTRKELELIKKAPVTQSYGWMTSYARVGIPAAVIQAIKACVRRATGLPDVDFPDPEEISNGLRWMRIGLAHEGVHFIRVTREGVQNAFAQRYSRVTNLLALEAKRCEVPCVLFLTVRVSSFRKEATARRIQLIHFLLVECHHMDGPMFT